MHKKLEVLTIFLRSGLGWVRLRLARLRAVNYSRYWLSEAEFLRYRGACANVSSEIGVRAPNYLVRVLVALLSDFYSHFIQFGFASVNQPLLNI